MHKIAIAIIDSNALTRIGLERLLGEIIPMAEIHVFQTFREAEESMLEQYAHFFVASRTYFEYSPFFRNNPRKAIVLVNGAMEIAGMRTLNICQSENALVRDILSLHSAGHAMGARGHGAHPQFVSVTEEDNKPLLSAREHEVAVLLCKGCINKEVADQLGISLATVVTHRKNIMEKLHARSLADIIIYMVINGLVGVEEL